MTPLVFVLLLSTAHTLELTSHNWCQEDAAFKYIKTFVQQEKITVTLKSDNVNKILDAIRQNGEKFITLKNTYNHKLRLYVSDLETEYSRGIELFENHMVMMVNGVGKKWISECHDAFFNARKKYLGTPYVFKSSSDYHELRLLMDTYDMEIQVVSVEPTAKGYVSNHIIVGPWSSSSAVNSFNAIKNDGI